MPDAAEIIRWQKELAEQPGVWAVTVSMDGIREQTGNLYDSREAAELEAAFLRRSGVRSAKVMKLGCLHNMKLSHERWADEGAIHA